MSNIFVTLPEDFKAIKDWPGYFYNEVEDCVYSIKVNGQLKKLKEYEVTYYIASVVKYAIPVGTRYYTFSRKGVSYMMTVDKIKRLVINEVVKIEVL